MLCIARTMPSQDVCLSVTLRHPVQTVIHNNRISTAIFRSVWQVVAVSVLVLVAGGCCVSVLVITVSVLVLVLSLLSSCYCVVCSRSVWQVVAGGCCVSVLVITVPVFSLSLVLTVFLLLRSV